MKTRTLTVLWSLTVLWFLILLTLSNSSFAAETGMVAPPVLIEPGRGYESTEPHFDPLFIADSDRDRLLIYDDQLEQAFRLAADWRNVDATAAHLQIGKAKRIPEWDGHTTVGCLQFIKHALEVEFSIPAYEPLGVRCVARAALAALGVEAGRKISAIPHGINLTLYGLLERLPFDYLITNPFKNPNEPSNEVGLPENVFVAWPPGRDYGENVFRIEMRQTATSATASDLEAQAYRFSNGMWCQPNRACICQENEFCTVFYLGLLAGWADQKGNFHWLMFSKSETTRGQTHFPYEPYTRLFHVVREPGKEPTLDEELLLKIETFVENQ